MLTSAWTTLALVAGATAATVQETYDYVREPCSSWLVSFLHSSLMIVTILTGGQTVPYAFMITSC